MPSLAHVSSVLRRSAKQKFPLCFGGVALVVVFVVAALLSGVSLMTSFSSPYGTLFLDRLKGPLKADDPELLDYIKNEVLTPPSKLPYNLKNDRDSGMVVKEDSEIFYRVKLTKLFLRKEGLFFVEAGALDGETMSNTLWLEHRQKWSGLLVEADSTSFAALRAKNRKAWSANVCLAPSSFPSQEFMVRHSHYGGPMSKPLGFKMRSMHSLAMFTHIHDMQDVWLSPVQCLPLQSLLMALQVSRVDLLSLDVEGGEMNIIENLGLDKFDVQVICLEWKKREETLGMIDRMKELGYLVYASLPDDLILVRKGSPYEPLINKTEAEVVHEEWKT